MFGGSCSRSATSRIGWARTDLPRFPAPFLRERHHHRRLFRRLSLARRRGRDEEDVFLGIRADGLSPPENLRDHPEILEDAPARQADAPDMFRESSTHLGNTSGMQLVMARAASRMSGDSRRRIDALNRCTGHGRGCIDACQGSGGASVPTMGDVARMSGGSPSSIGASNRCTSGCWRATSDSRVDTDGSATCRAESRISIVRPAGCSGLSSGPEFAGAAFLRCRAEGSRAAAGSRLTRLTGSSGKPCCGGGRVAAQFSP
jgi:hypothetical protein